MENPLWKKLQNDPALLKQFNQHSQISNVLEGNNEQNIMNGVMNNNGNLNGDNFGDTGGGGANQNGTQSDSSFYQNSSQSGIHKKNGNNLDGNFKKQHQPPSFQTNFSEQQQQQQQLNQLQYINAQPNDTQLHRSNPNSNPEHAFPNQNSQYANNQNSNINGSTSNGYYYDQVNKRNSPVRRELGLVEKLVGSYGFVKCLDRDGRLFFHYSSFQVDQQNSNNGMSLKIGDLIEFEEGTDKRNGKPIATNITKFRQNSPDSQQPPIDSLNMFNLNELLKQNGQKADNDSFYNQNTDSNQGNYQSIMNGLKMLNIQSLKNNEVPQAGVSNGPLNPQVMNLFNKENIYNNQNNMNQLNMNNNLLNMVKTTASNNGQGNTPMNDNLGNLAKILNMNGISLNNLEAKKVAALTNNGNEQMEGTIAIVATKRPITSQYNNRNQNYTLPQLDGRITYQRSGETFYIPYSLSDVVSGSPTSPMPNFNQSPTQLKTGDHVRFFIAQALGNDINVPAGTYYARHVELMLHVQDYNNGFSKNNNEIQQIPKQLYRGVITTLKESFGKIEREDMFKETFFHFHEYRGQNPNQELKLGLNVEFELQDRYGKEIACNVKMLPDGSVSFDEISHNVFIGRIIQPLTKLSNLMHVNLNGMNLNEISSIGKLIFDNNSNKTDETLTELLFSDLDRVPNSGNYTLLEGDFVQFRIATDKRKKHYNNNIQMHKQQRATQITLIEEHSLIENSVNTGEYRERGVLIKLGTAKELIPNLDISNQANQFKYGAIKCIEHNDLIYFSVSEVIKYARFTQKANNTTFSVTDVQLQIGDSLEFSVIKCQKDPLFKNGLKAIRVEQLAKNTVQFEMISTESYMGIVERESNLTASNSNTSDKNCGMIRFEYKNGSAVTANKTILFTGEGERSFYVGDKVQFYISTCIKTKKQMATNIKLVDHAKEQGFITILKDNYGFIELTSFPAKNQSKSNGNKNTSMPRDIFFHFSSVKNAINDLDIGDEVEFKINRKSRGDQKISAESLIKLRTGTIKPNNLSTNVYKGRIIQQLKSQKPTNIGNFSQENNQSTIDDAYFGKVMVISAKKDNEATYDFGLSGLSDKKKCFQVGDLVTFQLGSLQDGVKKAFNLQLQSQPENRNSTRGGSDLKKGKIDSIKGHCGFIEYSVNNNNDMKKVFFHISDLNEGFGNGKSESSNIQVGNEVEFSLTHNSRSGKYSAIKIKKLNTKNLTGSSHPNNSQFHHSSSAGKELNEQQETPVATKRPDHLITKLKIGNVDDASGKRLILLRNPGKPDGKSFSRKLFERIPGSMDPVSIKTKILVNSEANSENNQNETDAVEKNISNANISPLSIVDLLVASANDAN